MRLGRIYYCHSLCKRPRALNKQVVKQRYVTVEGLPKTYSLIPRYQTKTREQNLKRNKAMIRYSCISHIFQLKISSSCAKPFALERINHVSFNSSANKKITSKKKNVL